MQVAPSGGQICFLCKWRHLVAKFATYASGELEISNQACSKILRAVTRRERELIAKLDRLKSKSTQDLLEDTTEVEDAKPPSCHPKFPEAVANASNRASIGMYKEVLKEKSPKAGNLVMSASSVSTVLAMLRVGARGETLKQMTDALFLPHGRAASTGYRCLLPQLQSEDFTLAVANKIFLGKGFSPKEGFLSIVRKDFYSEVAEVDFGRKKRAAKTINTWVEDQTREKIKDLVKPGMLDHYTKVVLVNAIYFKADWAKQFKKKSTKNKQFHTTEVEGALMVPMMIMEDYFKVTLLKNIWTSSAQTKA